MKAKAFIVSVGTEHLFGDIQDTNSLFLCKELTAQGITVIQKLTLPDEPKALLNALKNIPPVEFVFTIGGLGPTHDDLTRETLAEFLEQALEFDDSLWARILTLFHAKNKIPTDNNRRQAYRFAQGKVFQNPLGTAPGLCAQKGNTRYILLPGPPSELIPMYQKEVLPYLQAQGYANPIPTRELYLFGIGESQAAQTLQPLFQKYDPQNIGIYAKPSELRLRLSAPGKTAQQSEAHFDRFETEVRETLKDTPISRNQDLSAYLGARLRNPKRTLSTAESLTGGRLSSLILKTPGASDYFSGGLIAYDNRIKQEILGVSEHTLKNHGAVSEPCAREMCQGARKRFKTDIALSVTGIAGPGGGTPEKPVGLVYAGFSLAGLGSDDETRVKQYLFEGTREEIQNKATQAILADLLLFL